MIKETNSSFEQNQHNGDARLPHSFEGAANNIGGGDVGCAAVEVRRCAPKEQMTNKTRRVEEELVKKTTSMEYGTFSQTLTLPSK